jgi:hypothetical protein
MLNFSYIYNLPFFQKRTDRLGKALGGWTFGGLSLIDSGFRSTPGLAVTPGLASRPDCVASANGPKTPTQWFNTAAFVQPAFGFYGNCGNGGITGPNLNSWDMALYKTFPIVERVNARFRVEAFNVWNHPSFWGMSTSLGSGNYGQLTSALDPRILEFALEVNF